MPVLFTYGDLRKNSLLADILGHTPTVLTETANLEGWREEDEAETICPDERSIVVGSLTYVTEDDLAKLDEELEEFERQQVNIEGSPAIVYTQKIIYKQQEPTENELDELDEEEKTEIIRLAMTRYKDIIEKTDKIRQEYVEDTKFRAGMQWSESVAQERQRDQRPMLTLNRLESFCNTVINNNLQNPPQIKIRPVDTVNDPATSDVISGLIRHILTQSESSDAFHTAFDGTVGGGFGFFRVKTDYTDDNSFDQEIKIGRIENPCAVYFPMQLMHSLDFSDAPYCFIRQKMSKEEFDAKYPDYADKVSGIIESGSGDRNWMDNDIVYIAEYFVLEEEKETLYLLPDGKISKEVPEGIKPVRSREVSKKCVKWYLINGADVLDAGKFPGTRIPIIPILGKEIIVDSEKHYVSLVRYMKEAQKALNFWWTSFTEAIDKSVKAPYLVEEGQIAPFKQFWENSNKPLAYLPYKATDHKGNQVPPPIRIEPPAVSQAILSGIQYAGEFLKDISGVHDASLGATSNERTGKAIQARAAQGALATYHFTTSYQRAMQALGSLLIEIIPVIYDTVRTVRIVGADFTDRVVTLNQVHSDPANPERLYDMTVGKYSVVVTTGPSYDTRRQETQDMLSGLMQTAPQLTMIFFDILCKVMDMPGSEEIAARAKRFIQQQYPGVISDTELGTPEAQLQMQIQAMTQDLQKLMQKSQMDDQQKAQMAEMLKQAEAALNDKQAQISATRENAILKAQTDTYKAQVDLLKTRINVHGDYVKHAVDTGLKVAVVPPVPKKAAKDISPDEQSET